MNIKNMLKSGIDALVTMNASEVTEVTISQEQRDSARKEMHYLYVNKAAKQNISETAFLEKWCKDNNVSYKTYIKWRDKQGNIYPKLEKRILEAIYRTFEQTTLAYYNFKPDKLLQLLLNSEQLLIESIWHIKDIEKLADRLKEAHDLLKTAWISTKETKNAKTHNEKIDTAKNALINVRSFLDYMDENDLYLHANIVAPIQDRNPNHKETLFICISGLDKEREDVEPKDILLKPNMEAAIT